THMRAVAQGDGPARPALPGGMVGRQCNVRSSTSARCSTTSLSSSVHMSMRKARCVRVMISSPSASPLPCSLFGVLCEALVARRNLEHHLPRDLILHFIRECPRLLCAPAPVCGIVYAE